MRFHIKTYGCQMNVRDSESVAVMLERHGLQRADGEKDAGLIIVNTCSVRGKAEDKAIGKLGLMCAIKRTRPDLIVGVMGCMAQRMGQDVLKKIPKLDFVVGTRRFSRIPAIVDCVRAGQGPVLALDQDDEDFEALNGHESGGLSAFVNILFGCDRRCAYCIVPDVRGHEWSRPGTNVVQEVRNLAANGVKEVMLLGQSVMRYGLRNEVWPDDCQSDFTEPFVRLLEAVCAVDGIERVRFTSSHPSGCTDELAEAMRKFPQLCPHIHLPMQSGSDRILKLMRRGYSSDDYRAAVARLREAVPDLAITTDVIVGFPGESEEDFNATRAIMEELGFDNSFIFKYSPRPGTPAADWPDDVSAEEKLQRNKLLLEDQQARGTRINKRLVGRQIDVLVEGPSLRNKERWSGRSGTNKIVVFDPVDGLNPGDVVMVEIDRAMPQTVYGKIVS